MQEERERSSAVAAALQQERRQIEEQQAEVIRQREAQLEAEREQREALAQQLQHSKVGFGAWIKGLNHALTVRACRT